MEVNITQVTTSNHQITSHVQAYPADNKKVLNITRIN